MVDGKCPDPDCKMCKDYHNALFEEDGSMEKLRQKVDKKMTKPPPVYVIAFLTAVLIPLGAFMLDTYRGEEFVSLVYAKKETVQDHETRIQAVEIQYENIRQDVQEMKEAFGEFKTEIKEGLKEQKEDITKSLDDIKELIKDSNDDGD